MDKLIPLQPLEEMTEHWVKVGLLDPSWLHFVERYIMGINNIDILKGDDGEEYYRADGDVRCESCGKMYRDHDVELRFSDTGEELWLRRLCDGKLIKL